MATRKKTTRKAQDPTLRHLWLAGIGAAVSLRREADKAIDSAAQTVGQIRQRAGAFAGQARDNVNDGLASLRTQGEAGATQFSAEVEARLAPLLAKLGLKPQATRAGSKRKTAGRKAAKRTTTKGGIPRAAAPARKAATRRTTRKARA